MIQYDSIMLITNEYIVVQIKYLTVLEETLENIFPEILTFNLLHASSTANERLIFKKLKKQNKTKQKQKQATQDHEFSLPHSHKNSLLLLSKYFQNSSFCSQFYKYSIHALKLERYLIESRKVSWRCWYHCVLEWCTVICVNNFSVK